MAIVLLHCSASSGAQWRALAAQLGGGDRVLAPAIDAVALMEIIEVALDVRLALAAGDLDCGLGRFIDYWSGPGSWAGMPPEKRAAFAPQLAQVALDFDALLSDPAGLDDVRDLGLPTLIVQGGATRLPSRCICRLLRAAMPRAKFEVVPDAGHMLPVTHRDQVNALIAAHIHRNSDFNGEHHAKLAA